MTLPIPTGALPARKTMIAGHRLHADSASPLRECDPRLIRLPRAGAYMASRHAILRGQPKPKQQRTAEFSMTKISSLALASAVAGALSLLAAGTTFAAPYNGPL